MNPDQMPVQQEEESDLLEMLGRHPETIISCGPEPQGDAQEPRSKLVVSGPAEMVDALFMALTDGWEGY